MPKESQTNIFDTKGMPYPDDSQQGRRLAITWTRTQTKAIQVVQAAQVALALMKMKVDRRSPPHSPPSGDVVHDEDEAESYPIPQVYTQDPQYEEGS